ncbi:MAG: glycosyltransferase family 4 protein [Flavobacteriaceae bacterium]|nr:glycosyltransferase family 4 protein [Flavobacteriaceae bacterium]
MKPRVLFLLHLPPPIHGSSMIGKYIKDSDIINNNVQANYINLLASESVNQTGKISFKKIKNFISTWVKVFLFLMKKKPDLCYLALTTTGAAFFRDVLLIMLLKLFRVKRVYHLHNKGVSIKQNNLIYKWLYKYTFKKANVILLSKILYEDVKDFVKESDIHICPNGIPETDKKIDRLKSKGKRIKLLFLSNLIESKGVFVLLNALAILNSRGLDFECNFIGGEGDISNEDLMSCVKSLNLERQIFYKGRKFNNDKDLFFTESDIFVFPTYYSKECFPLVLLEALKFSLPVVSTREGAISEIIEDRETGFLVEKQDAKDLADKIEILIKNEELRNKMSIKSRIKFVNNYTLLEFEKRIFKILNKIKKRNKN